MGELDKIKERYETRKNLTEVVSGKAFYYTWYMQVERELVYQEILQKKFGNDRSGLKVIEIGAGTGTNLYFFSKYGCALKNIWANELLEDRFSILKEKFPNINLELGDALKLDYQNKFDIVFQSTVFTSILDMGFKKKLANKMMEMAKKDGLILWYDFKYDNPSNKDVKGVGKNEIRELFGNAKDIRFHNVTLAPPIGRRINKFYNFVNTVFPFLRTHLIAEIKKQ